MKEGVVDKNRFTMDCDARSSKKEVLVEYSMRTRSSYKIVNRACPNVTTEAGFAIGFHSEGLGIGEEDEEEAEVITVATASATSDHDDDKGIICMFLNCGVTLALSLALAVSPMIGCFVRIGVTF